MGWGAVSSPLWDSGLRAPSWHVLWKAQRTDWLRGRMEADTDAVLAVEVGGEPVADGTLDTSESRRRPETEVTGKGRGRVGRMQGVRGPS